jgi:Protein of unknown function (DUF1553)/Protein of unknown function (DUF1549)/Planctomycete cytochrome C
MKSSIISVLALLSGAIPAGAGDFHKDIEPIFKASCSGCHQGKSAAAGLRVDSREGLLRVIVPGKPDSSLLMQRVAGKGGKRMPLGGAPLSADQIEALRHWIEEGAPWPAEGAARKHWAYVRPERPAIPTLKNTKWARNPIDRFVLARLEKEGLRPAPEASRETLIRRLSLDLTGLPPGIAEIDEFLSDTQPGAYERLVDRLLASPHYGERWARPWLDLARYADTNGYEADLRRSNWKYRDWVIQALNRDMPFDQFTIEQIAGDMLPGATDEQKIATGFLRNSMFNEEGGVDREEANWEVQIDRVNTVSSVWLGSTIGCAQCHNHKFDPFSQKEYYQLVAFFNNAEFSDKAYRREPALDLPTPEQASRRDEINAEIKRLEQQLNDSSPEFAKRQADWERGVAEAEASWTPLQPVRLISTGGSTLTAAADGSILASGANPTSDTYVIDAKTLLKEITAIRIEALPDASLPRGGPGRDPYGNFFLTEVHVEAGSKVTFRKVLADDGRLNDKKFGQLWSVDASREDQRLRRQLVLIPEKPLTTDALRIILTQTSEFGCQGLGHFRLSVTGDADPGRVVDVPAKLRPQLGTKSEELGKRYRSVAPELAPVRDKLSALRKQLDGLHIVNTLVMSEHAGVESPSAYLRIRGSFLSKGEEVHADVPSILPPLADGEPSRLGLARWLVRADNPLTARVTMNHIWEVYFGRGLVETGEDFGSQGARPSHPELLDWLAAEFMSNGWSLKSMHRLIVTSSTYRQSSRATPQLLERDPANVLLARGARYRLEAEMIRDVALASSGLLSAKIGGPSVFPYQPEGLWDLPYNDDKWVESKGEDRYRRGLYVFVRRTSPYPSMTAFDAPSREACTVRRIRTNTPLQALTTLNDPAFFEAAQKLAQRILEQGGPDTGSRAVYGFRLVTARRPAAKELESLLSSFEKERRHFDSNPDEARQICGKPDPELAAWSVLSNVLLNLDETLTRE